MTLSDALTIKEIIHTVGGNIVLKSLNDEAIAVLYDRKTGFWGVFKGSSINRTSP